MVIRHFAETGDKQTDSGGKARAERGKEGERDRVGDRQTETDRQKAERAE